MQAVASAAIQARSRPMSYEEKRVIVASSLGTVFEWYDFYLYGSLAATIGTHFFTPFPEATRNIFALLAFAAGFLVRPFGALVFGRLGDLIGRKHTFLITILIMGLSTFIVGLLPGYESIGIAAPIILILLRMAQGLALGGEYGGAAIYVAEHAPQNRRGFYTSFIQTTATLGLFLSLVIILSVQAYVNANYDPVTLPDGTTRVAFAEWGWRVPFIVSIGLLIVSVYIRTQMNESPAFKKMKEEGTLSKAPLSEAFGQWKNARIALLALLGMVAGQAVVWYTGQFYALFYLQSVLKVDQFSANVLIAWALALGTGGFLFFGWLSDKIGRKPIILAGCAIAAATYFPLFNQITRLANPGLHAAHESVKVVVQASQADCSFQFNPVGSASFTNSCDQAKALLARSAVNYTVDYSTNALPAKIVIGEGDKAVTIDSFDGAKPMEEAGAKATTENAGKSATEIAKAVEAARKAALAALSGPFTAKVNEALYTQGYPIPLAASITVADKATCSKADAIPTPPVTACDVAQAALKAAQPKPVTATITAGKPDSKPVLKLFTRAIDIPEGSDAAAVTAFGSAVGDALTGVNYAAATARPPILKLDGVLDVFSGERFTLVLILTLLVLYVTMVYGPIAAALVEFFPTRIRYSGMSLPYHIGNGWFGGLLPATSFAMVAQTGDIYYGLWYPIVVALGTVVIGLLFVPETHKRDIFAT